jgi:glycosyltransferase involved in cell wall biosynthesis
MNSKPVTGIIIPCYKVRKHILQVLRKIDDIPDYIYVVDDKCPEQSGQFVVENQNDPRVKVLFNPVNLGVGGAVKEGYKQGLKDGCQILVKIDGDGQMDPKLVKSLIKPIVAGEADYVKGNRFYKLEDFRAMPRFRLIGNSVLSFLNKMVNGYWNIMDPTNGFTAIHNTALSLLPLDKIDNRYFFESDMLFRLGTIRAVVKDFPIVAVYADEQSNLKISRILFEFPPKYLKRFIKRIFYTYILRDFNVGTLQLVAGAILVLFSLIFGVIKWIKSIQTGIPASPGTVMVAALPFFLGFQLLLSGLYFDISNVPAKPLQQN